MGDAALFSTSLIGGASSLANGISQSGAYREQGKFASQMGQMNASFANLQAQQATQNGELMAEREGTKAQALIGAQKASYAAQGVSVNSGSAASAQADMAGMSAIDQLMIRNNAAREAWGYKVSALSDTTQGKFAALAGKTNANSTMLTGGLGFLTGAVKGGYYVDKGGFFKGSNDDGSTNATYGGD